MDLLRHLRYFVTVAEELHFGRAATRLHMAQPPLSQRIRGLEKHLGVSLFERSSRHVALTPAGRLLLPEARELIVRAERAVSLAERMRADEPAELRAAVMPALSAVALARAMSHFGAEHPEVRLVLREVGDDEQLRDLAAGNIDVGLVRQPAALDRFHVGVTLAAPLGVVLASSSPLAAGDEVELSRLRGLELVLFARDAAPGVYDELLAECHAGGFVPSEIRSSGGAELAAALVITGRAVAFSEHAPPPDGCVWRPLAGEPLLSVVSTVRRPESANEFAEAFERSLVDALGAHGWSRADAPAREAAKPRPAYGLLS